MEFDKKYKYAQRTTKNITVIEDMNNYFIFHPHYMQLHEEYYTSEEGEVNGIKENKDRYHNWSAVYKREVLSGVQKFVSEDEDGWFIKVSNSGFGNNISLFFSKESEATMWFKLFSEYIFNQEIKF